MKPEWLVELTRRDGGAIDMDQVMDAWRNPRVWRRPMWLGAIPRFGPNGTFFIGRSRFCLLDGHSGNRSKALLYAADPPSSSARRVLRLMPYFQRVCLVGLGRGYRAQPVCRLRELAYCGALPGPVVRYALPILARRLGLSQNLWLRVAWTVPLTVGGVSLTTHSWYAAILGVPMSAVFGWMGVGAIADAIQRILAGKSSATHRTGWADPKVPPANICWAAIGAGVCHACGHDLDRSIESHCPECGRPNLRWWCERNRLAEAAYAMPGTVDTSDDTEDEEP